MSYDLEHAAARTVEALRSIAKDLRRPPGDDETMEQHDARLAAQLDGIAVELERPLQVEQAARKAREQ